MIKNSIRKIVINSSLLAYFLEITKLLKVSFIVGSQVAFFSFKSIISPMTGILGGLRFGLASLIVQSIINIANYLLIGGSIFLPIGYHVPHFFASFYWLSNYKINRFIIPFICFILFIAHPIGNVAWLYAALWFIPMLISFFGHNNLILRALGSTFTAHAVGSVLWIYFVPMAAQAWISLIPVVLVERSLFASGMLAIYYGYNFVRKNAKLKNYIPAITLKNN